MEALKGYFADGVVFLWIWVPLLMYIWLWLFTKLQLLSSSSLWLASVYEMMKIIMSMHTTVTPGGGFGGVWGG